MGARDRVIDRIDDQPLAGALQELLGVVEEELVEGVRQGHESRDRLATGTADLLVVDNNSPPDPALARLRRTPGVEVKRFDRNTGFARAANEGCRRARGEWVLLLNPDTAVPDGFLDQLEVLCRSLEQEEPRAGVVGLALRDADGTEQASSGPPPTLARTLAGMFLPRRVRKCRRWR